MSPLRNNLSWSWVGHVSRYSRLLWRALKTPILVYFVLAGNFVTALGASVFWWFEHTTNSQVRGYFDAVWWAFATVSTVGYGDIIPVTLGGRVTAMILMVVGISLFVGFTALLVGTLDAMSSSQATDAATATLLRQMHVEMKALRDEMKALRAAIDERA